MSVMFNYMLVIVIWATTPLAIKLSNDNIAPIAAVSLRMLLSTACAVVIMLIAFRGQFFNRANVKSYFAASLALFPNMPIVYYAATYIPSGLIAVMVGLLPFVTAFISYWLLGTNLFTWRRMFAQLLALVGLLLISLGQISLDEHAYIGVLLMLLSSFIYAFSNVWVKRLSATTSVAAMPQTVGALLFSLPGFISCWFLTEGSFDVQLTQQSTLSILYLAIVGSLIGFVAFYRVLNLVSLSAVSLIPVISPILALLIGVVFANESLTLITIVGVMLIICGLIFYEGIETTIILQLRHGYQSVRKATRL